MRTDTDRIEKKFLPLRAQLKRVWLAISDSKQFGSWHGVKFDRPFVAGGAMVGTVVPSVVEVDPEVAKSRKQWNGTPFSVRVERIEPMRLFSMRWYPFDEETGVDYSNEPWTLVEFRLEEVAGGTMLTITESGFDAIPLEQRIKALNSHEQGWAAQPDLIDKYLAMAA
jgi:uncharacterized protein YndB with AHSA1/START domain